MAGGRQAEPPSRRAAEPNDEGPDSPRGIRPLLMSPGGLPLVLAVPVPVAVPVMVHELGSRRREEVPL